MMHSIVELDCSRVADQLDSDPLCFFNYRTIRRELGLEVEMLELAPNRDVGAAAWYVGGGLKSDCFMKTAAGMA